MTFLTMAVTTRSPDVDAAADAVMDALLEDIADEARASLLYPKHGRAYWNGVGYHVASAPGEPPASDSGELMDSIKTLRFGDVGFVAATTPYADFLEHGTPGGRMLPRPFMGPAWRKFQDAPKYKTLFAMRLEALG